MTTLTFDDMVNNPCAYFASELFSSQQLLAAANCLVASGCLGEKHQFWEAVELAREVLIASEMECKKFQDGDVVRLVSGGPLMTAEPSTRCDGLIACAWFDGAQLQRDAFDAVSLRMVPPDELSQPA